MVSKGSSVKRPWLFHDNLKPEYLALMRLRREVQRKEELLRKVATKQKQRPTSCAVEGRTP
jgi:hypothetical protein